MCDEFLSDVTKAMSMLPLVIVDVVPALLPLVLVVVEGNEKEDPDKGTGTVGGRPGQLVGTSSGLPSVSVTLPLSP